MRVWRTIIKLVSTGFVLVLGFQAGPSQAQSVNPEWRIAFIRGGNIWLMNADGSSQRKWRTNENILGNLSWAPDGERIAYVRRGEFSYALPDGGGGSHRLYDVFASHIDSTRDDFWWWVTFNHGSRTPEWSRDGKYILYCVDRNANLVDAELPDYKIEYRTLDASEVVTIDRDGAGPRECQGIDPTWSPDRSQVAFAFQKLKTPSGKGQGTMMESIGLVVVPTSGIVRSDEELERDARLIPNVAGPVWSPDGRWICYINSSDADGGIYLVAPDGKTTKKIFNKTSRVIPYRGKPSWSPDSRWITFASTDGFIFVISAEGGSAPQRITSNGSDYFPAFAP